jgi:ATP-dependent helicase/nuclease subunit B
LASYWQENTPDYPIIAAGSTGSIPSTAVLLETIANLPNGMVILPYLDLECSEQYWQHIEPTHPQFGLKQLLERMKCKRTQVKPFPVTTQGSNHFIGQLMAPSAMTHIWQENVDRPDQSLQLINADNEEEEANIIAFLMRETLETAAKTATLVTPDRTIARRVKTILKRYDIEINDSSGTPLTHTAAGTFLLLAADWLATPSPINVISLIKHPLFRLSQPANEIRHLARQYDKAHRTRDISNPSLAGINDTLTELRDAISNASESTLLNTFFSAIESLSIDAHGTPLLWYGEEGEAVKQHTSELLLEGHHLTTFTLSELAGFLRQYYASHTYRKRFGYHPRLRILSPIEARLQHFDRVILAGLNEGTWPSYSQASPWLSRPMRHSFGLHSNDHRIGQSAHDFISLISQSEVFLTRAEKVNNQPTIASRWLTRLEALLDKDNEVDKIKPEHWQQWHKYMLRADIIVPSPPKPSPPISSRANTYSVTDIQWLLCNPYRIYAKKTLKLLPLESPDQEASKREFGILMHSILEDFTKTHPKMLPEKAFEALLAIGREQFDKAQSIPDTLWWPCFKRIAAWFISIEEDRRKDIHEIQEEYALQTTFHLNDNISCTLNTRIDRSDIRKDKTIRLIDYKTGEPPSKRDIEEGIALQLPLEALLYEETTSGLVSALEYWKVSGTGKTPCYISELGDLETIDTLKKQAKENLLHLLSYYLLSETPYLVSPQPGLAPLFNDYHHLERASEWR